MAIQNRLKAYIKMSRLSNLPTTCSNTLVGIYICGGSFSFSTFICILSIAFYYIGGMFLNDVCDHEFDLKENPNRPIPSGIIQLKEARIVSYIILFAANILLLYASLISSPHVVQTGILGVVLTSAIIFYNYYHKNKISPFIMAICRTLIYLIAASLVKSKIPSSVFIPAIFLGIYIVALTFIANGEHLGKIKHLFPIPFLIVPIFLYAFNVYAGIFLLWILFCLYNILKKRDMYRGITGIIAGISLFDATIIANTSLLIALCCFLCFLLTTLLQQKIAGT